MASRLDREGLPSLARGTGKPPISAHGADFYYCGQSVRVKPLDLPVNWREDPASDLGPRAFVMIAGSGWLLHRCEIPEATTLRFD